MVNLLDLAGIHEPELRNSFELCEQVHAESSPTTHHLVSTYLPAQKLPYAHALYAYFTTTDDVIDEGDPATRAQRFDEWKAATLREIDSGDSVHALRRAFVHTVRTWGLSTEVLRHFLAVTKDDGNAPVRFTTFEDLRVFLRGVAGAPARLLLPLLEPQEGAERWMSLLGEVLQLVDIHRDFPEDLARDRCYLPAGELTRFGVARADLVRGEPSAGLDALVELQVRRARQMVDEGAAVLDLVHPSSVPFLQAAIEGCRLYFDHVERLGWRIFTENADLDLVVPAPRRAPSEPRPTAAMRPGRLPGHVAVIMDGNGRWAQRRGRSRLAGHAAAEHAVFDVIDGALEIGLSHLTAFVFSAENWSREVREVRSLMDMLARVVRRKEESLYRRGVRVIWSGRRDRVPVHLRAELESVERRTAGNDRLTLVLCLDYGGRAEIFSAARRLAEDAVAGRVDLDLVEESDFDRYLHVPGVPDVDLLIRTSGEQRISNFQLWQVAYAELVFDEVLWPDFDRHGLWRAVEEYVRRDSRYGAVEPTSTRGGSRSGSSPPRAAPSAH